MVSMTPEEAQQAETVKRIGEMLNTPWGHDVGQWVENCEDLREIIDSQTQKIEAMQKQLNAYSLLTEAAGSLMQKQYTEEEMRHAFEDPENRDPVHDSEVERNEHGEYKDRLVEVAWFNFMRCARFLGAIKEKKDEI